MPYQQMMKCTETHEKTINSKRRSLIPVIRLRYKAFSTDHGGTASGLFRKAYLGQLLVFVCGHRQISADSMCAVNQCFQKHSLTCCRDFFWNLAMRMRSLTESCSIEESMAIVDNLWRSRIDPARQLVYLLARFRSRHCIDPRDKVYGL